DAKSRSAAPDLRPIGVPPPASGFAGVGVGPCEFRVDHSRRSASYAAERTGAGKLMGASMGVASLGPAGVLGVLIAPKRLKCRRCGTNLKQGTAHGAARPPEPKPELQPAKPKAVRRQEWGVQVMGRR